MRYKLRTLLIVLALGPAVLASAWQWGVPVFVFLFWPKNPNEDMIAAVAKSVLCAIAAIFLWTLSFRLQPTPNGDGAGGMDSGRSSKAIQRIGHGRQS